MPHIDMTKNELFQHIVRILQDSFEIEAGRIAPEARLYEDLDIDSIDAVDLIVQLKPLLGSSLKPEAFKTVRTVQDVVDVVHGLLPNQATA
ncbi:acyl carrier protein [Stenotrophomonas koreensis]|nr:acyl carrier protein [Stenotrophomonas koreensis]